MRVYMYVHVVTLFEGCFRLVGSKSGGEGIAMRTLALLSFLVISSIYFSIVYQVNLH